MPYDSMKQLKLDGEVWSLAVDGVDQNLYVDVRIGGHIHLVQVDLGTLDWKGKRMDVPARSKLVGFAHGCACYTIYPDQNDPSNHEIINVRWDTLEKNYTDSPIGGIQVELPSVYDPETEYHRLVSRFLAQELPLSSEYLEWNEKIIISYYLRSGNGFDRYLVLLEDGKAKWSLQQDVGMKGFAPGAFFVFGRHLIFIKDRNEVCVYTG